MNYQERLFRQTHGYGCEPATIIGLASLAISATSAVTSIQAQNYAADAQATNQRELTDANNKVAREQMSQLRQQEAQLAESTIRENEKARRATQKAKSSASVAASEAGVSGASVDALLNEYSMNLGQFREATNRQTQVSSQGINAQIDAVRTGARFQNLSINAPIARPNVAAEAVKFSGSALGVYRDYNPNAFDKKAKPKS